MSVAIKMPTYKSHKTVSALKIREVVCHAHVDPAVSIDEFAKTDEFQGGHIIPDDKRYGPIPFDADYFRKHRPKAGGYYVVFQDGYKSFSPAEAFEDGYTLISP